MIRFFDYWLSGLVSPYDYPSALQTFISIQSMLSLMNTAAKTDLKPKDRPGRR